jgi:hypothetical protein
MPSLYSYTPFRRYRRDDVICDHFDGGVPLERYVTSPPVFSREDGGEVDNNATPITVIRGATHGTRDGP